MIKTNRLKRFTFSAAFLLIAAMIAMVAGSIFTLGADETYPPYDINDKTWPTVTTIYPSNEARNIPIDTLEQEGIRVVFSENMDQDTVNSDTFFVEQRTTPQAGEPRMKRIKGVVTGGGREFTFWPKEQIAPDQQYGNVFTVTITSGAKDLAGNSIQQDYVWSFTTEPSVFYTDGTTANQDQNVAVPVVTPVVVPAPVPEPVQAVQPPAPVLPVQEEPSNMPYILGIILGALLLILVVGLLIGYIRNRSAKHAEKTRRTRNPFSDKNDIHSVKDIEGINAENAKRLERMGIHNTEQLWHASPSVVAKEIGVSQFTVRHWQDVAELMAVKGIGPQSAELLDESGVHSISQLGEQKPTTLLSRLTKQPHTSRALPGYESVAQWIKAARHHKYS